MPWPQLFTFWCYSATIADVIKMDWEPINLYVDTVINSIALMQNLDNPKFGLIINTFKLLED